MLGTYYISEFATCSFGLNDAGVGSVDDGRFWGMFGGSASGTLNASSGLMTCFASRGGFCKSMSINVATAFAVASTNTFTAHIDLGNPADAIILSLTALGTGLFQARGNTRFEAGSAITSIFNSDDGTDPALLFGSSGSMVMD